MKNRVLHIFMIGILMILGSQLQAVEVTLNSTDDAEIDQHVNWRGDTKGIAHLNWGWDASQLRVQIYDPSYGNIASHALIKWDVTGIASNAAINSVTLEMSGWDGSDGPIDVYGIAVGSWEEETVTWNSWAATTQSLVLLGQLYCAGPANAVGQTTFSSNDLASWVQSWVNGSQANNGIILKMHDDGSAGGDSFSSKEDPWSYGHAPQLKIAYQVPEPTTLILLAGGMLSIFRRRSL
jgi:hypothetical protein